MQAIRALGDDPLAKAETKIVINCGTPTEMDSFEGVFLFERVFACRSID